MKQEILSHNLKKVEPWYNLSIFVFDLDSRFDLCEGLHLCWWDGVPLCAVSVGSWWPCHGRSITSWLCTEQWSGSSDFSRLSEGLKQVVMNLWQVQVVNRPGDRDLLSLMIGETYERQIRDIFFWYLGVGQFESPCFFFQPSWRDWDLVQLGSQALMLIWMLVLPGHLLVNASERGFLSKERHFGKKHGGLVTYLLLSFDLKQGCCCFLWLWSISFGWIGLVGLQLDYVR